MSTIPGRRHSAEPPYVDLDTPIGPDVDLERQDVRLPDGRRLTPGRARAIVRDTRRGAGRPPLTGSSSSRSPQLSMRIPDHLMAQIRARAAASGKTLSQTAREALEQVFKAGPAPGARTRGPSPRSRGKRKTKV
ncbi:MAG: hypothetical protein ACRDOK_26670 [Streptosporangiaceae bacterium]